MKTLIIIFSQTGNTKKIADSIGSGITDVAGQCDMVSLKEANKDRLLDYDLVGLGSPVFYYKEPFNVGAFLESLPDISGKNWFLFCTHGNVIGNFFPSTSEKLARKGARVIGYHNSYADITVPFYPKHSYTSGHPDETDFENARAFGREMAEKSPGFQSGELQSLPVPGPVSSKEWIDDSHLTTQEFVGRTMPNFTLDREKCSGCGACEENCPVDGIEIDADPPRLQEPCIYCFRCVNVCPTLALNADWTPIIDMAPENYQRYKRELDMASEQGLFRWLVDPESVDISVPLIKIKERKIKKRENRKKAE